MKARAVLAGRGLVLEEGLDGYSWTASTAPSGTMALLRQLRALFKHQRPRLPAPKGADDMNAWTAYYAWPNFSSMVREADSARASRTDLERSHHLTACLYFGVAALEGFINSHMREHLEQSMSDEDITKYLSKGSIMDKLKKWPKLIIGRRLDIDPTTITLLKGFNSLRGNLTHPKKHTLELARELSTIEPAEVVNAVAEYIVHFHVAAGTAFPYWVFGWNYLNPRTDTYEIAAVNEGQFLFSLQALGFGFNARPSDEHEAARGRYLGSFAGYCEVRDRLNMLEGCEPKQDRFPHMPILCRRWWTPEHQEKCGRVTRDAIERAHELDRHYAKRGA